MARGERESISMNNECVLCYYLCLVKMTFRLFSFAVVVVIYALVIGINSSNLIARQYVVSSYSSAENHEVSASVASDLLCHTAQTEGSITVANSTVSAPAKNTITTYSAVLQALDDVFFSKYSPFCSFSDQLVLRFSQTDIIFPFHYFW